MRVTASVGQFTPFQYVADVMRGGCQHSMLPAGSAGTVQKKVEPSLWELKRTCSRLIPSSPALRVSS